MALVLPAVVCVVSIELHGLQLYVLCAHALSPSCTLSWQPVLGGVGCCLPLAYPFRFACDIQSLWVKPLGSCSAGSNTAGSSSKDMGFREQQLQGDESKCCHKLWAEQCCQGCSREGASCCSSAFTLLISCHCPEGWMETCRKEMSLLCTSVEARACVRVFGGFLICHLVLQQGCAQLWEHGWLL